MKKPGRSADLKKSADWEAFAFESYQERACRLLADLFADLGGKRRKICIRNAYLIDSIDSGPSWQSGGHGFDPRQLQQQKQGIAGASALSLSSVFSDICRTFADAVSSAAAKMC